ncbi:MAG: hypothetical protein Q9182_005694 [Xanthomendoza sp. 2 TL-2023]
MNTPDLASIPPEIFKQDRGPRLVIVIWVFALLTLATVGAKVWTRCKILRRSGIEDVLMFLAWLLSVIYGALLTASVKLGLGKHPYAIDPTKISQTLELYTVATSSAAICAFVRIAYVALLNDVKDYTYSSINHTLWAVIEGNVIIIAACLPDLRPFVKHVCSKNLVKDTLSSPSSSLPARLRKTHLPPPLPLGHKTSQPKMSDASTSFPSPLSPRRMEPRPCGSVSGSLQPPDYKTYRLNSFERLESNQRTQNEKFIGWRPGFCGADGEVAETNEREGKVEEERRSVGAIDIEKRNEAIEGEKNEDPARTEADAEQAGETEAIEEIGKDDPASAEPAGENEEQRGRTGKPNPADAVEAVDETKMERGVAVEEEEEEAEGEEQQRRESQVQELREFLAESRASARQSWIEQVRERVDKRMTI